MKSHEVEVNKKQVHISKNVTILLKILTLYRK